MCVTGRRRGPVAGAIVLTAFMAIVSIHGVSAGEDLHWEHKDWRSHAGTDLTGRYRCGSLTGGDGGDSFNVLTDREGNVSLYYAEATARGHPTRLEDSHTVRYVILGKRTVAFDAVDPVVGVDAEGIPYAHAGPADAEVADLVPLLRTGARLRVERAIPGGHELLAEFSLSGFTANWLKLTEWCD